MRRSLIAVCAVVALAGACAGGDESADTTGPGNVPPGETTAPADTIVPDTTETDTAAPTGSDAPATEPPTTEPPATDPPATEPPVESPLEGVEPITVESTDGDRPRFSWDEVEGAREYSLVVATSGGDVIWAWRGRDTEIDLGAGLIEGNEGPRLTTDSVIDVFALAADGTIVAASGPVPLAP